MAALAINMADLKNEIHTCFKSKQVPTPKQLVNYNGFDTLDKEDAVKFFSGKSWHNVLDHLRSLKNSVLFGADFRLEELSVLEQDPREYYLKAYLEFFFEILSTNEPDCDFVSHSFY